jgi:type II secretory pathway component PulF
LGVDEMQEYICTVKEASGKTIRKYKTKSPDETTLVKELKSKGLFLVEYQKVEPRKDIIGGDKIKLSLKDIATFSRQLSAMLPARPPTGILGKLPWKDIRRT